MKSFPSPVRVVFAPTSAVAFTVYDPLLATRTE
jgi:hypothetical protein